MLLDEQGLKISRFEPMLASVIGDSVDRPGGLLIAEARLGNRSRVEPRDWLYCLAKAPGTWVRKRLVDQGGNPPKVFIDAIDGGLPETADSEDLPQAQLTSANVSAGVVKMLEHAEELLKKCAKPKVTDAVLTLALIQTAADDLREMLVSWAGEDGMKKLTDLLIQAEVMQPAAMSPVFKEDDAVVSGIETLLPRSIYLETKNGMMPIAKEGAILPVDCTVECKILHEGETSVEVEVYQESDWVSRLQVSNIPADAGSGCKVKITVTVTKDNRMVGKMQVVSSTETVLAEGPIDITFPPLEIPDLARLRSDFDELETQREQLKNISIDVMHRVVLAGKGRKIAAAIEKAFQQEPVDRQWIHEQLKEFKALVTPPADEMKPPRCHFAALLEECRRIIADHPSDPQIQSFSDPIGKFEKDGYEACTNRHQNLWTGVIDGLEQIHSKLKKLAGEEGGGGGGEKELPPTPILKDHFRMEAESLRSELQTCEQELSGHPRESKIKVRAQGLNQRIDQMIAQIDRVGDNIDPKSALPKLQLAFRDHLKIKKVIESLGIDLDIGIEHSGHQKLASEVPTRRIDKVHFLVSSPPTAQPGRKIIVDVWGHLERQRAEVERRVQQGHLQPDTAPVIRPKGPFKIERGTTLFVRLKFPGFYVEPPEDVILWEGEIGNASFVVAIPSETTEGLVNGLVTVHWEGGFQIAKLPLQILVAARVAPATPTNQPLHRIHKAFASYASADRDEVMGRVQGMQKIAPDLDVFLDVVNLRSGDDWEKTLLRMIEHCDVFYLFWSVAASASPWVEKEWRCALKTRGDGFIDPVPLVSPEEVRPPDELCKKHFNDWTLAFRRGRQKSTHRRASL